MINDKYKTLSFFTNIFIGEACLVLIAVLCAAYDESYVDYNARSLESFVYVSGPILLIIPNIFFYLKGKFDIKKMFIYQILPVILGFLSSRYLSIKLTTFIAIFIMLILGHIKK